MPVNGCTNTCRYSTSSFLVIFIIIIIININMAMLLFFFSVDKTKNSLKL